MCITDTREITGVCAAAVRSRRNLAEAHPGPRAVESSCAAGAPLQLAPLPALLPRQFLHGLVLGLVELEAGAALQLAPLPALLPRQFLHGLVLGLVELEAGAALQLAPLL